VHPNSRGSENQYPWYMVWTCGSLARIMYSDLFSCCTGHREDCFSSSVTVHQCPPTSDQDLWDRGELGFICHNVPGLLLPTLSELCWEPYPCPLQLPQSTCWHCSPLPPAPTVSYVYVCMSRKLKTQITCTICRLCYYFSAKNKVWTSSRSVFLSSSSSFINHT
jgi:hypothetical protein